MQEWDLRSLIDELNRLTKLYDAGSPEVSDKEWDDLYFKLEKMEQETGIIYPDSPTQHIIFEEVSELQKIEHNHPMLSLAKTKDANEVQKFVSGHDWLAMFKMDGLTVSLTYENGKLTRAETRGNGIVGEDVWHNICQIKNVPKYIPTKKQDTGCHKYDIADKIVIDGEIICTYDNFEQFKSEYKNPRNFASGSIRLLNSAEAASRNLSFVAWDLVEGIDEDFFFWRLEKLDDWGFTTVPRIGDAETVDDAIQFLDELKEMTTYPIDGYVFKFESKAYGESLGRTDHHFKNAIAYKFYDETYSTRLRTIDWTMGRTGVLTPVAIFDPIEIDGSTVERASLHNYGIMRELLGPCAYVGEPLEIYKANMIIPQVKSAGPHYNYGYVIANAGISANDEPEFCPYCGGPTSIGVSPDGVRNMTCGNPHCEGKLSNRIDHFFGKKGLDVKGISTATIDKLIDWGWVNSISDMFNLHAHQMEWMEKNGFGKASVFKILDAIDAGRTCSLTAYISAIGIPLVGTTVAKEIVKYYDSWDDFRNAVGGDWTEFEGFGPEISKAINSFDYTEADKIAGILTFKQPEIQVNVTSVAAIKDKTFCVTGKLHSFKNRDALKVDIEALGGRVVGSMSSKVDYLINNDKTSTSAKNKAAQTAGIPIISEDDYLQMKS